MPQERRYSRGYQEEPRADKKGKASYSLPGKTRLA
jgi:hypothetical protein